MVGAGPHRGFAFVEYHSKEEAKVSSFDMYLNVCIISLNYIRVYFGISASNAIFVSKYSLVRTSVSAGMGSEC